MVEFVGPILVCPRAINYEGDTVFVLSLPTVIKDRGKFFVATVKTHIAGVGAGFREPSVLLSEGFSTELDATLGANLILQLAPIPDMHEYIVFEPRDYAGLDEEDFPDE